MFRTSQPTVAEMNERLLACERQLADHQVIARLFTMLTELLEKFRASRETLHIEIVRWPAGFVRQLQLANVKCDATVRETTRMHSELLDDLAKAQEIAELLRQQDGADAQQKAQDIIVRLRRQLHYRRDDLQNLGVTIRNVSIGEPFNSAIHEPLGTTPADELLCDTIAEARTPLYSWKDEQGLEQHVPAQVTVLIARERAAVAVV